MCKIFAIEGPDYSGKTTLINTLYKYLKSNGKRVAIFKEPEGTIRKMLLDKDGNLSSEARRCLFAADHFQTLDTIYEVKDKYDYIFMDRTTVISDLVYSPLEDDCSGMLNANLSISLQDHYDLIDICKYDNFFKENTHLILLQLSKQELINRMSIRAINSNDIFDIKSDDFKFKVWSKYNELIDSIMNNNMRRVSTLFCNISAVQVDDNLTNNIIKLIGGDK